MKQELADKIIEKCPQLFSKIKHIEAPDGWFNLIEGVCILLEQSNKTNTHIVAAQIKEKFGSLRVYTDQYTPYTDGIIRMAEVLSSKTCYQCGNLANMINLGGWYIPACQEHNAKKRE